MNQQNVSTILVAEDHELFGDGITMLLKETFTNAHIKRANDFDAAWSMLQSGMDIDLMLMDLKMPGTKGLNGVRAVKHTYPCQTLIVLSSMDSSITVNSVMALGVNGFISKSTEKAKIKAAIRAVLEGNNCIESAHYKEQTVELSKRQLQTLQLMANGKSNKEIAKILDISPHTVKEYVSIVMRELDVDNRTQAVQIAEQLGLLFDSEF